MTRTEFQRSAEKVAAAATAARIAAGVLRSERDRYDELGNRIKLLEQDRAVLLASSNTEPHEPGVIESIGPIDGELRSLRLLQDWAGNSLGLAIDDEISMHGYLEYERARLVVAAAENGGADASAWAQEWAYKLRCRIEMLEQERGTLIARCPAGSREPSVAEAVSLLDTELEHLHEMKEYAYCVQDAALSGGEDQKIERETRRLSWDEVSWEPELPEQG